MKVLRFTVVVVMFSAVAAFADQRPRERAPLPITGRLLGAAAQHAAMRIIPPGETLLTFSINDAREEFVANAGPDLVMHVRRAVDAHGHHFGWDLSITDRRLKTYANFFYECLCGHGPSAHDLYAWHFGDNGATLSPQARAHLYPAERRLPVYGYPFDITVRCVGCEINGQKYTEAEFTKGSVEISARRLPARNPRQRTLRDLRRGRGSPRLAAHATSRANRFSK